MTEEEYVDNLEDERRHFAWVMQHRGELYWTKHPELLNPPPEYTALS
ncbi:MULTISPECIES: hypothetical protein [Amycolatopsis]|uniref:Uncharacterized protein n=1 Tax=Amycolatopsis albidoflavus TaxID=102226 RepID=A0ABW5I2Y9_9PSEU